jgi:hypothetical protein
MLDKNVPGPGKYDYLKPFGADGIKFSIKGKGKQLELLEASKIPGPGSYKPPTINPDGKFPLSTFCNIRNIKFGDKNDKRFNYSCKYFNKDLVNKNPGPNHYDIRPLINGKGQNFLSKFKNNNAISIAGKPNESNKNLSK